MKKTVVFLLLVLFIPLISAATLKGTIYNANLEPEADVLVQINTIPEQRMLAKNGEYSLSVSVGTYTITAQKGILLTKEDIKIVSEGQYVFDLFLLSDSGEEDLWNETNQNLLEEETGTTNSFFKAEILLIVIAIIIIMVLLYLKLRAKTKKKSLTEVLKTENKKKEIAPEEKEESELSESALEQHDATRVLEFIKNNAGRITQKELRKEMMHLSEAKISLILTELEHKGRIEKIKKGRGNVIILKKE